MRHSDSYAAWRDPNWPMDDRFCRMSYILFRTDRQDLPILASRCPETDAVRIGAPLADCLALTPEAFRYLILSGESYPYVTETRFGIGLLIKRYDLCAGVGLYLHIHSHPDAVARLIQSQAVSLEGIALDPCLKRLEGKVTARDSAAYDSLATAWSAILHRPDGCLISTDPNCTVHGANLSRAAKAIASFAGCHLTVSEASSFPRPVRCYSPILLEAMLLILLSEARVCSATRGAVLAVSTIEAPEGENLTVSLEYTAETEFLSAEMRDGLIDVNRHLARIAELAGLNLQREWIGVTRAEQRQGMLPRVRMILEWQTDPTLLSTADLKSRLMLASEPEVPNPLFPEDAR